MRTDLASWVHLGCIPLGLVLEVDLVPLELGLGFSECELSLSQYVLSVNTLSSEIYFEIVYPVREGADLWDQCQYQPNSSLSNAVGTHSYIPSQSRA